MASKNKAESYLLELTAAIVFEGELLKAGELIEVTEKEAKNLLGRGKARLAAGGAMEESSGNDLAALPLAKLRQVAKEMGIDGAARMKKDDILAAIEAVEDDPSGEGD